MIFRFFLSEKQYKLLVDITMISSIIKIQTKKVKLLKISWHNIWRKTGALTLKIRRKLSETVEEKSDKENLEKLL